MTNIQCINLPYQEELVSLYPYFRDLPYPILLDSNHPHFPDTKYDILVADPICEIQADTTISAEHSLNWQVNWRDKSTPLCQIKPTANVFDYLQKLIDAACQEPWAKNAPTHLPFTGGLMGYFGYESGQLLETLPSNTQHDIKLPDLQVGLYSWAIISLHASKQTLLMLTPWCDKASAAALQTRCHDAIAKTTTPVVGHFALKGPFVSNTNKTDYMEKFQRVQDYIQAGDCYQVNLAHRFSSHYHGDTFTAYQRLRKSSPMPFSAFIETANSGSVMSHSPERFLQVSQLSVESKPIKGTRPRGKTEAEDMCLAQELLNSEKDKAENLMIVDLLRNDLGKTCEVGSIKVPKLFDLESYANVHHLVSTITGTIKSQNQHLSVFRHSFPGGSITGAPKIRAMEIIDELELHERSIYCGSIAYFSVNGEMDSSITIRSLVADGDTIHCWAGGGLVADSDGNDEYKETFTKVKNLTDTLEHEFLLA